MLYGEKTRLRRIEREDIPTFVRWFADPEVRNYLLINSPISHAQEEKWFESKLADEDSELFAVETLDGTHIGNIELFDFRHVHRQAELGVVLGEKAYWSQGYGSDAIRVLLRFAFRELNLHRIQLRVYEDNERGIRCYRKCGFQVEGRLRDAVYRQGRYFDVLMMGILDHEFTGS